LSPDNRHGKQQSCAVTMPTSVSFSLDQARGAGADRHRGHDIDSSATHEPFTSNRHALPNRDGRERATIFAHIRYDVLVEFRLRFAIAPTGSPQRLQQSARIDQLIQSEALLPTPHSGVDYFFFFFPFFFFFARQRAQHFE